MAVSSKTGLLRLPNAWMEPHDCCTDMPDKKSPNQMGEISTAGELSL